MEKLKILFISRAYPPIVGGIENQNFELGKWLGKIADVRIIANTRGKKFLPFFLPYATLKAIAVSSKYDAVLLGDGVLGMTGWILKLISKKPVICVVHGLDLTFASKIYQKLWVGAFIPKIDKLIAVGNETVRIGIARGLDGEKLVFIPNGVDTEKHLTGGKRSDIEKIVGQPADSRKILLTSGRLAKRKGVAWFVANVMPKLDGNFIYVIAGDGPDKQNIADAIRNNGLEKRVVMLGYVSNDVRNTLLNTADLFVQPNIRIPGDVEGFGISVIEAGACRLPVLASGIEGLRDAIKEGRNGFLVESENAEAFVRKIDELFSQGNPREIHGQTVREYVAQNYSWHNIAQKYLEEIGSTISKIKS